MSTVVGFFDDKQQAEMARNQLLDSGISKTDIQLLGSDWEGKSHLSKNNESSELSFGEKVKRFFTGVGDWDDNSKFDYYAEGVRRGGITLAVTANDSELDRVCDILNSSGATDIDRRAQFYKESGFSKYDFEAQPYSNDERFQERSHLQNWEKDRFSDLSGRTEEMIPVVEEKVNIGKRAIEKGRVRVFTHVTETPVDQDLRLREERVEVDRIPVDRPVDARDMEAFKEGEIEFRETAEEAVVEKQARVIEEVRIRKQSDERTETIHETAKRTDVEVDRSNLDQPSRNGRRADKDMKLKTGDRDQLDRI